MSKAAEKFPPRIPGRVLIAGMARQCAPYLPGVFANLEKIAAQFDQAVTVFLENDSGDNTRALLQDWCAGRSDARVFTFDGLDRFLPIRTLRLAFLRNAVIDLVRESFADFDYLYLLDCDVAAHWPMEMSGLRKAARFLSEDPSRAAVFPNQTGIYVDIWALREPNWCPGDAWEETLAYMIRHGASDTDAFKAVFTPIARRTLQRDSAPLKVQSAFGGAGLYKVASVLANPQRYLGHKTKVLPTREGMREYGWQMCEHVNFNLGFSSLNQSLYIFPDWINQTSPAQDYPASGFRLLVFELKSLGKAPDWRPVW